MDLRRRVLSSLGWSAGARFTGQLITWSITIVVMRLLTPQDYGLMAIAGVFIGLLMFLNELGLGAALIQKQHLEETILRRVFGLLLLVNLGLFLLLLLSAPLIAAFFEEQRVVPIIRLLSVQFLMISFCTVPRAFIQKEMDFKKISLIDFVASIVGAATTLILAWKGAGVWSLVWGSLANSLCRTMGLNATFRHFVIPSFAFKGTRSYMGFGGYVVANRLLWYFYTQADVFVIGKLLGKELLGYYSVAKNLANLPIDKVSSIISQVAFPAYSSIQTEHQRMRALFLKAIGIISFVAFPVSWGISSIAPEFVATVLGDKWHMAVLPLQLLCLAIPIHMVHMQINPLVLALGQPNITFKNLLFLSIVMTLGIVFGSKWGLTGVSLAWLTISPIVCLCNIWRSVKVLKIKLGNVLSPMFKPILSSSIMYLLVMGLKIIYQHDKKSLWYLSILILWGGVSYGMATFALNKRGYREAAGLLFER
jgi:teichuronic acid exporter